MTMLYVHPMVKEAELDREIWLINQVDYGPTPTHRVVYGTKTQAINSLMSKEAFTKADDLALQNRILSKIIDAIEKGWTIPFSIPIQI